MPMSTKCQKKMTITVIQHDDRHDRKKSYVYRDDRL
jgi:hypothetical protein